MTRARVGLVGVLLVSLLARPCPASQSATNPGFTIALSTETTTVNLHDPIWVTVQITNVSGVPQEAWFGPRFLYQFQIVENETGSVVASNPWNRFGYDPYMGREYMVAPGDSMSGRFRLDLMYEFKAPGVYTIKVTKIGAIGNAMKLLVLHPMPSNTITITVLP